MGASPRTSGLRDTTRVFTHSALRAETVQRPGQEGLPALWRYLTGFYDSSSQSQTSGTSDREERTRVMFLLLLPGAICAAVGLGIVRTVEAVQSSFKQLALRTFTR